MGIEVWLGEVTLYVDNPEFPQSGVGEFDLLGNGPTVRTLSRLTSLGMATQDIQIFSNKKWVSISRGSALLTVLNDPKKLLEKDVLTGIKLVLIGPDGKKVLEVKLDNKLK